MVRAMVDHRQIPRDRPQPRPLDLSGVAAAEPPAEFLRLCEQQGIAFDPGDLERLGLYLALLLRANQQINLTAVREPDRAWIRHIFDSLTLLAPLADLPPGASVIDVGAGGGLPGVPLAVAMPHLRFTLLEATGKKADFLRAVCGPLHLRNVAVLEQRAERAGQDRGRKGPAGREAGHRERYDAVVARAVGPMATVAELTIPFATVGGRVLLVKGERAEAELAAAGRALHLLNAVHAGTLQTPTGRIVVLEKRSATPRDYPRRDGEPKRRPLGAEQPDEDR